ncbi:hypothetical protein N0V94_002763 [Neodidymelliopsis sp. IMI 364377]|nr:hypothetical protein N0V94_002763 [Neodidymelliopsis sp. IMI 364377]
MYYRATNPSVQDEGEVKLLREMAKLHARRCPRCQYMIVKDGGCDHVHCEQCHTDFYWPQAEVVVAPVETFVPAASATTFQGWARLREAQQNYIVQNNISDQPFNIGTTESPQQDEGLFFFNPDFNFFNPERCELDAIAARTAGKRLIRAPKHDHGGVWAFVEIGPEHFGGFELGAAIEEEQRQNHNIRLVAHPLFEDFADDIDIHWPFPELDEEEPDAEEGETIDIDFVLRQAIGTRHLDVAVGVRRLEALAMAGGFEQVVDDILHGRPITIDW